MGNAAVDVRMHDLLCPTVLGRASGAGTDHNEIRSVLCGQAKQAGAEGRPCELEAYHYDSEPDPCQFIRLGSKVPGCRLENSHKAKGKKNIKCCSK